IVDAAVVADMAAPIAVVPAVAAAEEAPVAGCPESAVVGRGNPDAGDPVVAVGAVVPVAGGPYVVGVGGGGLFGGGGGGGGVRWRRYRSVRRRCRPGRGSFVRSVRPAGDTPATAVARRSGLRPGPWWAGPSMQAASHRLTAVRWRDLRRLGRHRSRWRR